MYCVKFVECIYYIQWLHVLFECCNVQSDITIVVLSGFLLKRLTCLYPTKDRLKLMQAKFQKVM